MSSLYKQSVPVFIKYLRNLSALVEKGKKFADEKGMKHEELITFRLVQDMRGYVRYHRDPCEQESLPSDPSMPS